jgi:ribonuclease Z
VVFDRYGSVGAHEVLAGLKCVWISHIHADHHTGLARILAVRRSILEKRGLFQPILVIGPKQLKRFLDAYERLEDLGMEFLDCSQTTADAERYASSEQNPFLDGSFLKEDNLKETVTGSPGSLSPRNGKNPKKGITADAENVQEGNPARIGLIQAPSVSVDKLQINRGAPISPKRSQMRNFWLQTGANLQAGIDWEGREKLRETLSVMGLAKLRSVPVVHCAHAFGVMLEAQGCVMSNGLKRPGWKLVYSGDTRPCKALVDASQDATVLIHEATFDDGLLEEAEAKRHSLTKEAIETGVAAGVYRTILTHFSQRYPKIPVFDDSYTSRTCIAFDMMSVNFADLPLLPSLLPALKALFKEELLDVEEAADEHQEL